MLQQILRRGFWAMLCDPDSAKFQDSVYTSPNTDMHRRRCMKGWMNNPTSCSRHFLLIRRSFRTLQVTWHSCRSFSRGVPHVRWHCGFRGPRGLHVQARHSHGILLSWCSARGGEPQAEPQDEACTSPGVAEAVVTCSSPPLFFSWCYTEL